jgi:hypothetical protein
VNGCAACRNGAESQPCGQREDREDAADQQDNS